MVLGCAAGAGAMAGGAAASAGVGLVVAAGTAAILGSRRISPELHAQPQTAAPVNAMASNFTALALLAFVVGAILLYAGASFDTTRQTAAGFSVHNIGLMQERTIILGGGALSLLVGVILAIAGAFARRSK